MIDQTKISRYKHLTKFNQPFWRNIMKKMILAALFAVTALSNTFAQSADLVLDGERWLAKWTAYVCDDGHTQATEVPAELAEYNVEFNHLGADYSLDNIIVKASYEENGVACSYSAILFADNAAWTVELVESRGLPVNDCANGKAVIDSVLEFNSYKYLHGRAAIFVPFSNAEKACNDGSGKIGIHFQVYGRN